MAASTSGLLNIHSKKGPNIRKELRKHQKRQPSRFMFLRQLPKIPGWSHHHSASPAPGSSSPPALLLHHHELSPPRCLRATDPAWLRDPNRTPSGSLQQERWPAVLTATTHSRLLAAQLGPQNPLSVPRLYPLPPAFSSGVRGGSGSGRDPSWVLVMRTGNPRDVRYLVEEDLIPVASRRTCLCDDSCYNSSG